MVDAPGLSDRFRWFFNSAYRWWSVVAVVVAVLVVVLSITGAVDERPLEWLGAACFWAFMAWYLTRQTRVSKRHRDLRARRKERERQGLAPVRED